MTCERKGCTAPATVDDRGFPLRGQVFFTKYCDAHGLPTFGRGRIGGGSDSTPLETPHQTPCNCDQALELAAALGQLAFVMSPPRGSPAECEKALAAAFVVLDKWAGEVSANEE